MLLAHSGQLLWQRRDPFQSPTTADAIRMAHLSDILLAGVSFVPCVAYTEGDVFHLLYHGKPFADGFIKSMRSVSMTTSLF